MKLRTREVHPFEPLEPRRLRAGDAPQATDANDYHMTLNASGAAVVTSSPNPMARSRTSEFTWYDGTSHQGLAAAGGAAFEVAFCDSWYMWPTSPQGGKDIHGDADEAGTREIARMLVDAGVKLIVLDNESWKFDIRYAPLATVDHTITRMKQVIDWIRDEEPSLKVGIYGYMSQSDDSESVTWPRATKYASEGNSWYSASIPAYANHFARWQATSEYLRPLSESVDYVFPALYTGTTDPETWAESARITIEDSRRFGKPVIPFLWPLYHPGIGNSLGWTEVPADFWGQQLDLVREHADSVYIWNGVDASENAPWVATTVARANASQAQVMTLPLMAAAAQADDESTTRRGFFSDAPVDDLLMAA